MTALGSEDPTELFNSMISSAEDSESSELEGTSVLLAPSELEGTSVLSAPSEHEGTSVLPNTSYAAEIASASEFSDSAKSLEAPDSVESAELLENSALSSLGDQPTAVIGFDPENEDLRLDRESETTLVAGIGRRSEVTVEEKVSFGRARPSTRTLGSSTALESDARINQAENLRISQERLLDLEKELEKLREENEQFASANAAAKEQIFELSQKAEHLAQELSQNSQQYQSEIQIYRDSVSLKEVELIKSRTKIDELETRLRQDLRKIRVRERELENRLELTRMEKEALLSAKDDAILDLKRKLEQSSHEVEGYRQRVSDLNSRIETNNDQFARTVRTLRLALTNLEVSDSVGAMGPILKKAE